MSSLAKTTCRSASLSNALTTVSSGPAGMSKRRTDRDCVCVSSADSMCREPSAIPQVQRSSCQKWYTLPVCPWPSNTADHASFVFPSLVFLRLISDAHGNVSFHSFTVFDPLAQMSRLMSRPVGTSTAC